MSRSRPDLSETEGGVPALLSGGHRLANLRQHLLVSNPGCYQDGGEELQK